MGREVESIGVGGGRQENCGGDENTGMGQRGSRARTCCPEVVIDGAGNEWDNPKQHGKETRRGVWGLDSGLQGEGEKEGTRTTKRDREAMTAAFRRAERTTSHKVIVLLFLWEGRGKRAEKKKFKRRNGLGSIFSAGQARQPDLFIFSWLAWSLGWWRRIEGQSNESMKGSVCVCVQVFL